METSKLLRDEHYPAYGENDTNRSSAVDERTTRRWYVVSQRKRKRVEQSFGGGWWMLRKSEGSQGYLFTFTGLPITSADCET